MVELKEMTMIVERQKAIKVSYKNIEVGEYYADLIIDNK